MKLKKPKWKMIGVCAMDTARLLIADPCYVIDDKRDKRGSQEINDYMKFTSAEEEHFEIPFRMGHAGAGIMIHSPYGDGSVNVYGLIQENGSVSAVFFSFDGKKPRQ